MRVIVTGASGFIGGYLIRNLAARGVDVVAVSRRAMPGGCLVEDYSQSPAGDVLVHLAENNDRASVEQDGHQYESSAITTLSALLSKGYGRFVYASSAVLYGDASQNPHPTTDPVYADDVYTRVKHQSESAVLGSGHGIAVRLANIYGKGMPRGNVMSTVLEQIPGQQPLSLWDESPVRDFLWVEDAVEGIATLATALPVSGSAQGVVNLGTGVGTSIGTLARMALDLSGESTRTVVSTRPSGKSSALVLDVSETAFTWGWRPATTLRQGLERLLTA